MADLLRRTLEFMGYEVHQVMNITDVGHLTEDDLVDSAGDCKLEREAARRNMDPWAIARLEEQNFKDDLALMMIPPAAIIQSHRAHRANDLHDSNAHRERFGL